MALSSDLSPLPEPDPPVVVGPRAAAARLAASDPDTIQPLGICLDNDPVLVPSMLADHGITWPVFCDGRGWQGELVRSLGINAMPVLWIVDRHGILLSLDAKQDAGALIEKAARQ